MDKEQMWIRLVVWLTDVHFKDHTCTELARKCINNSTYKRRSRWWSGPKIPGQVVPYSYANLRIQTHDKLALQELNIRHTKQTLLVISPYSTKGQERHEVGSLQSLRPGTTP